MPVTLIKGEWSGGSLVLKSNATGTTLFTIGPADSVGSGLALITLGAPIGSTAVAVGANTDRVAGISVNISNSGATITGLRGCDFRVSDTGTSAANIVGVQGVATKTSGVGSGELYGGNFIATQDGGFVENVYGVTGVTTVAAAASVGTAGRPDNYLAGGVFTVDVANGATLGSATIQSAVIAVLVGNNTNGATKVKSDSIYCAIVGGDSATVTGGAAFKIHRQTSIAASILDYGLDMYSADGGGYLDNAFAVSDIRLSSSRNIYSGVAITRAAVRALVGDSAPQGSVFIGNASVATTKPNMYVKVLAANADTDWERVVTAATD